MLRGKFKKIISVALAVPAVVTIASEADPQYAWEPQYVGVQIAAVIILLGVLAWNGAFRKEFRNGR